MRGPEVELLEREAITSQYAKTSGSVRLIASSGRRSSKPHLPPEQYCTISSASPPTENPKVSIMPSSQARSTWSMDRVNKASTAATTEKTNPTASARLLQPSTKAGASNSAGSVLACVS